MANRYKAPNLNVNYFLCGQGCARNEAADGKLIEGKGVFAELLAEKGIKTMDLSELLEG